MDSRKVSSLSVTSDGSDSSVNKASSLILEEVGSISVAEAASPSGASCSGNLIALLAGETHVFLAELRLRADSDCVTTRRGLIALPGIKDDKHYMDVCLVGVGQGEVRLAALGEKKNKERFVVMVEVITSGRALALGEELAIYDKASMLGKGLSHVTGSVWAGQPGEGDIFTFSNLIRKLRAEDSGAVLKPTTGRVPIPPECMDGTIDVCIASSARPDNTKKSFSVIASFKTKSAGKMKFQINWFQGKKDDLSVPSGKSSMKLGEDQEPTVILADPRDARAVYVICNNRDEGSAALYKIARGRKLEDPISTFPFTVIEAVFVTGQDNALFLLVLEPVSLNLKIFHLMKTEGFRGQQPVCASCPDLQKLSSSSHVVSCCQTKWQLSPQLADLITSPRCPHPLALATLLKPNGDIALEPESGDQYRVRVVACSTQQLSLESILLDDLERTFESEEESLSNLTLKICSNFSPGRESMSQLSAWLMAGRIACVEIHSSNIDNDSTGSDRLIFQNISPDTLRSYLVDQDWTQRSKKAGTFVLDSDSSPATTPAAIRSSTPMARTPIDSSTPISRTPVEHTPRTPTYQDQSHSRIPSANRSRIPSFSLRKSPVPEHNEHSTNNNGLNGLNGSMMGEDLFLALRSVEESMSPVVRASSQIKESIAMLEKSLHQLKVATQHQEHLEIP